MEESRKRSLSKSKEKILLTWGEYILIVDELYKQIKKSKIKFNYIYGIPRGGMIPAVILSHKLNINCIVEDQISYAKKGKLLIVDDIIDTGNTIQSAIDYFKLFSGIKIIKVASIFKHKKTIFKPDFYVKENSNWIVFPYEKS